MFGHFEGHTISPHYSGTTHELTVRCPAHLSNIWVLPVPMVKVWLNSHWTRSSRCVLSRNLLFALRHGTECWFPVWAFYRKWFQYYRMKIIYSAWPYMIYVLLSTVVAWTPKASKQDTTMCLKNIAGDKGNDHPPRHPRCVVICGPRIR